MICKSKIFVSTRVSAFYKGMVNSTIIPCGKNIKGQYEYLEAPAD